MSTVRIALANVRLPASREEAVSAACAAIGEAGERGAAVVCFPECFVPGYRWPGADDPPPDPAFLAEAWERVSEAARHAAITVILGTERPTSEGLQITACVFGPDGSVAGWQDKCQLDPQEEADYPAFGTSRRLFSAGEFTFGVVICHEGWRYPETVRWAARSGAQAVFHPFAHVREAGAAASDRYADPENSFHEMAVRCRAAENGIFFASVNCAGGGALTSAIARPDGSILCHQPRGQAGLLVADLDLAEADRALALRLRPAQE